MKTVPLRSVATVLVSTVDKKSVDGEQPVRLCNYTDVYYERQLGQDRDYMAATATADQRRAFHLRVGDTVITKDSETADDIGAAALVVETAPDFVCGYHLAVLRPGSALDPRFLYWQVAGRAVQDQMSTRASGVTRYGLTSDVIRGLRLVVSDLEDQRRVADFLDDQVGRLEAAADEAQHVASAAEQRLFALVAEGLARLEAPVCQLRRLLTSVRTGTTPTSDQQGVWSEEGQPWLTPGDLGDDLRVQAPSRFVDPVAYRTAGLPVFEKGSVLVVGVGATAGRVALLDRPAGGNQQLTALRPRCDVSGAFLAWSLWARRAELIAVAPFTTLPLLTAGFLRSVAVAVPDADEQDGLARRFDDGREHCRTAVEGSAALRRLLHERKAALITACVTGEFDVSTASDRASAAALAGAGVTG